MRNDRPWSAGVNRRGLFWALCFTARRILAAALLAASIVYAGISNRRSAREWFDSGLAKKGQTQQQKNDCEDTLHGTGLLSLRHSLTICKLSRCSRRIPDATVLSSKRFRNSDSIEKNQRASAYSETLMESSSSRTRRLISSRAKRNFSMG